VGFETNQSVLVVMLWFLCPDRCFLSQLLQVYLIAFLEAVEEADFDVDKRLRRCRCRENGSM
jgi:hypothetical protein